jgi:predicted MFS family arabinose efflux permease
MIAVNQATAILALFFGPLADRMGYRLMMLSGLALLVGGMFAAGFLPFYGMVLVALFLAGLGKSIFDPAVQAYISERIPYRRRGLAIGILEIAWAGSALIGIPLVGLLMEGFRDAWRQLFVRRRALGTIGFTFLAAVANDNLFVVYGVWIEEAFNLSVVALGLSIGVIGIAELLGESLTAALSDRIGLKRSVIIGLVLSTACYAILPFCDRSISMVLAGLFLTFITFEFMVVTSISLTTELLPGSRATMLSGCLAAAGIGRVIGALIGGPIWLAGGILATGMVSAGLSAMALVSLVWGLHGWHKN